MILVERYAENYDSRGVTGNNIITNTIKPQ